MSLCHEYFKTINYKDLKTEKLLVELKAGNYSTCLRKKKNQLKSCNLVEKGWGLKAEIQHISMQNIQEGW